MLYSCTYIGNSGRQRVNNCLPLSLRRAPTGPLRTGGVFCSVYRCFREAVVPRRTLLSRRLLHHSTVLRRRLPQSQLARQAIDTFQTLQTDNYVAMTRFPCNSAALVKLVNTLLNF